MAGKNDAQLNVEITASGAKATAEVQGVHKAISDLSGGPVIALQKGFHSAAQELSELAGVYTGNRLSGLTTRITELAESVGKIPGGAGLAVGAVAGIGLAAFEAGKTIFELAKHFSELGEKLFEAQRITGFSAATLSTLNIAAEHSGMTLEQVTKGVEKFARLMGEAADGSDTAKESLKRLGVESTDLNEGLAQAIKTIYGTRDGLDQINLSQLAFSAKAGPEMLRTIDQLKGNLEESRAEMEKWGLTLTQKDIVAAHEFHETLGVLELQAAALGRQFISGMMPQIMEAMTTIMQAMRDNRNVAAAWGQDLADTVHGTVIAFQYGENAIVQYLALIGEAFGKNEQQAHNWADDLVGEFGKVIAHGGLLFYLLSKLGAANRAFGATATLGVGGPEVELDPATMTMQPVKPPEVKAPALRPPADSGGGKRAKAPKDNSEQKDLEASLQLQQLYLKRVEEAYKETSERLTKEFEKTGDQAAYSLGAKQAIDTLRDSSAKIVAQMEVLEAKRATLEKETANQKLLREEKVQDRRNEINKKIADETDKVNKHITDADKKLKDERDKLAELTAKAFEKYRKEEEADAERSMAALIETNQRYTDAVIADNQAILDDDHSTTAQRKVAQQALLDAIVANVGFQTALYEQDRDRKIAAINAEEKFQKAEIERTITNEEDKQKLLLAIQNLFQQRRELSAAEFQKRLAEIGKAAAVPVKDTHVAGAGEAGFLGGLNTGQLADLANGVQSFADVAKVAFSAVGVAVNGLAEGFGSLVETWVLMGTTGPDAMRKMTASILASIAKQAAVRAIFELAAGFASLFWDPAEAADHFYSAALFGSIAGISAIAGRAVAGNAFKNQTASGGAGATSAAGTGANGTNPLTDPQNPQNRFTEKFTGYVKLLNDEQRKFLTHIQERTNTVLGGVEDTLNGLATRLEGISPDHVLRLGAAGASDAIFDAHQSALGTGSRAEQFRRTLG